MGLTEASWGGWEQTTLQGGRVSDFGLDGQVGRYSQFGVFRQSSDFPFYKKHMYNF